jgi:hypothetical protein
MSRNVNHFVGASTLQCLRNMVTQNIWVCSISAVQCYNIYHMPHGVIVMLAGQSNFTIFGRGGAQKGLQGKQKPALQLTPHHCVMFVCMRGKRRSPDCSIGAAAAASAAAAFVGKTVGADCGDGDGKEQEGRRAECKEEGGEGGGRGQQGGIRRRRWRKRAAGWHKEEKEEMFRNEE